MEWARIEAGRYVSDSGWTILAERCYSNRTGASFEGYVTSWQVFAPDSRSGSRAKSLREAKGKAERASLISGEAVQSSENRPNARSGHPGGVKNPGTADT